VHGFQVHLYFEREFLLDIEVKYSYHVSISGRGDNYLMSQLVLGIVLLEYFNKLGLILNQEDFIIHKMIFSFIVQAI
jgi:hypothetical protein